MYKALIIDNERPARTVISALGNWSKFGIEPPATACNGADGLACMRELKPDIVFVDMRMPLISGSEFLKLANIEFPNTKYIVVSGYDDYLYTRAAIQNGAIDYLLKPIAEKDLNAALEKAVQQLNSERNQKIEPPVPAESDDAPPLEQIPDIIKKYLEKNYTREIKLDMFSKQYFFTKEYLTKLFKKKFGYSIYEYTLLLRMNRAKELLQNDEIQIQEIAERLGYRDNNYFSKAFKNYFGISPSDYRIQKNA